MGRWPARIAKAKLLQAGGIGNMFYTYVLRSKKDNYLYIGWTDNLRERFVKHLSGKVESTADRNPLELVYYEACNSKTKAIQREKQLKTGFGRKDLKGRI